MQIESKIDLNDFQHIKTINDGQFEDVALIENKKTKTKYIARTNKKRCDNESDEKAFLDKIKIYFNIKYPSIISFIGFSFSDFQSQPYPTVVIEYIPSKSLLDFLNEDHQASISKYKILLGISLGMEYLYSHNIIIGQLATSNILLDDQLHPKNNIL